MADRNKGDDAMNNPISSKRRRIATARRLGLKHQGALEKVLDEIGLTRLQKCIHYGETRYSNADHDFNRFMTFSDVHRKYIRLEQQMKARGPGALKELRETYLDLAAYAAMGVQLIDAGRFGEMVDYVETNYAPGT
jgi:hypothetical protein